MLEKKAYESLEKSSIKGVIERKDFLLETKSSEVLWATVTIMLATLEWSIIIKGHCVQQLLFIVLSFKIAFLFRLREKLIIFCTSPCSQLHTQANYRSY